MIRLLSILLLLCSFSFIHSQTPQFEDARIPFSQAITITSNQPKYYRIDLTNRQAGLDVSLLALGLGGSSPNLYASKSIDQINTPESAPYSSKPDGGEVVYIINDDIQNDQTLYVAVVCKEAECNAQVTFEYAKEIKILADGLNHYQSASILSGATLAVVRLQLPSKDQVQRIVIHAEIILPKNQDKIPQFEVLINQGQNIPHTSRVSNIARTAWFEGRTIVIHKGHSMFCPECSYTLSMKVTEQTPINIQANIFGDNVDLQSHHILDGVLAQHSNFYQFKIRDAEEDFIIQIRPQQGHQMVYIDCDDVPADPSEYYWQYSIQDEREIVLTSREHAGCKNEPYSIAVYGIEDSVYSIRAIASQASSLKLQTHTNTIGDIFPGETITYEVFMPIFSIEQFMVTLRPQLDLEFNVSSCRFTTDCPGLLPATVMTTSTEHPFERNETQFEFTLVPLGGADKRLIIDPHSNGCYPILIQDRRFMSDPIPVCAYKFTLHSNQQTPVEYTLEPQTGSHDWMFPGMLKMDSVSDKSKRNYMLYVPQTDINSVIIQVTKFSGDVEVLVSRKTTFPENENDDDTEFSHEGMIVYNNTGSPLNGTYYITVKGTQTSSYSIASFVIAKDGERLDYALQLEEGVPQKGVLFPKHEHPLRYYKFKLDLNKDWEGSVRLVLSPNRGRLMMVVNNNDIIPMPSTSIWKAKSHDLEILSSENEFKRNGTYHIGVFMDWTDESALVFDDITFNIVYYLQEKEEQGQISNKNHLMLTPIMPYHGNIKKGEIKYFKISIANEDSGLTIYKQSDAGGVDMFLSTDPDNEYPDSESFDHTTLNTHANYISLELSDIKKICTSQGLCNLYLSVIPSSDQDITAFSLYVKRDFRMSDELSVTPLEDGKLQIHNTPENENKPVFFYFYAYPRQDSIVSVTCPGKRITIYALEIPVTIGNSVKPEIELPNPKSYSISTLEGETNTLGAAHLTIPPNVSSNSSIVSLAVYFDTESNSDDSFTIVVNSEVTHIYTGQPYYGAVRLNSYVYFKFDVSRTDCTLLISLTTLDDGNPDLVVAFGEDVKPTIENARFTAISDQRTELIEINNMDIRPQQSMAGTWIVGVYGRTASAFTLTVLYEDQKTVELKAGIPFEMFLKDNSLMHFKYYHEQTNDIEIKIDKFSGELTAYVTTIKKTEIYSSNLPNQTHYSWKIDTEVDSQLKIMAMDPKACADCLYVIAMETKAASKFVINVVEDTKFIKIQSGLHYSDGLEPAKSKSYVFTSVNADEVIMNIHITGPELLIFASQNPLLSNMAYDQRLDLTDNHNLNQIMLNKADFIAGTQTNGSSEARSERNSFYFLVENPTIDKVNYTFIVMTKDSNILLRPGIRQRFELEPKDETSWFYYSSHENEIIKIIVDFHMLRETNPDDIEREKTIANGLPFQGTYWREKQTTGQGEAVYLNRGQAMNDQINVKNTDWDGQVLSYRQVLSTPSRKGKFEFIIQNPFDTRLRLGIRLYRSAKGAFSVDQNAEHTSLLERGQSEEIEIYLAHRGPWYLWVYTCSGSVEVNIQDNSATALELESSSVILEQGQDHLYTSYNQQGGVKAVKIKAGPKAGHDTQYYLSTSHFFEDKVYDFETLNSDLTIISNYNFDPVFTVLHVTVPAIQFEELDPTDEIVYSVRVCPVNDQNKEEGKNVCGFDMECRSVNTRLHINTQHKIIENRFDDIKEGSYFVKAVANVYHSEKMIRFVPYHTRKLHVGPHTLFEDGKSIIGYLLIVLVVIIVVGVVGYFGYKKFQVSKSRKGLEMQHLPPKKMKTEYATVGTEAAEAEAADIHEISTEKV